MTWDLHKSCKRNTHSPHISFTQLPRVLTACVTDMQWSKSGISIDTKLYRFCLNVTHFSNVRVLVQNPSWLLVVISLLVSSNLWESLGLCLSWPCHEYWSVILYNVPQIGVARCFLFIRGYAFFCSNTTKVIILRGHMTLEVKAFFTWLRWCLPGFSTVSISPFVTIDYLLGR